jgi:hypothetical protein
VMLGKGWMERVSASMWKRPSWRFVGDLELIHPLVLSERLLTPSRLMTTRMLMVSWCTTQSTVADR